MFNLVSRLIATAAPFAPEPAAPAANPTQRSPRRAVPIQDTFARSSATGHAAEIGALGQAEGNARTGASLLQVAARGLQAIDAVLAKMQDERVRCWGLFVWAGRSASNPGRARRCGASAEWES